jgi:hypothetical protein
MSKSARWGIFTVVGIVAWLGATVFVAATNPDPSDATPILRTFAIAGGVFFGLVFAGAAWEVRHTQTDASERLYHRLAVAAVPRRAIRAAVRRTRGMQHTYLAFAAVTTGLLLTMIAFGEAGPYRELAAAMMALVMAWLIYSIVAHDRAFAVSGELLAPLGLAVTDVPGYALRPYGGGGDLVGRLAFAGERYGRQVSVSQAPRVAATEVRGAFRSRSVTSPTTMASLTGEPARFWQDVEARAGDGRVLVRRSGNGAGRWYLYDLLLAERLADELAAG